MPVATTVTACVCGFVWNAVDSLTMLVHAACKSNSTDSMLSRASCSSPTSVVAVRKHLGTLQVGVSMHTYVLASPVHTCVHRYIYDTFCTTMICDSLCTIHMITGYPNLPVRHCTAAAARMDCCLQSMMVRQIALVDMLHLSLVCGSTPAYMICCMSMNVSWWSVY